MNFLLYGNTQFFKFLTQYDNLPLIFQCLESSFFKMRKQKGNRNEGKERKDKVEFR